ncbi:hypothetical protein Plhal304r1_c067g0155361 [Plasmopara halstedii]
MHSLKHGGDVEMTTHHLIFSVLIVPLASTIQLRHLSTKRGVDRKLVVSY